MDETCNQKIASPTSSSPVSTLDNVITYALLGVVISGGETKGECMKFWTKAWTMAREIGLHREDSDNCPRDTNPLSRPSDQFITPGLMNHLAREEIKEERRRTWWLLFIADRHLALCYNSPLNILDSECTVNQPLDDETWQDLDLQMNTYHTLPRSRGPATKMTGTGLFEYFLPLMAVLGDIVDIHHLSNHPRFAGTIDMEAPIRRVEQSLEIYQASLKAFEQSILLRFSDMDQPLMASSPQTIFTATRKPQQWSAEQVRYKTVIAYSNHLLHVLYILLHGPWDPMTMLDSAEQRIVQSNRSFVKCAQHAISAASSVSEILKFDPELSFMPYLFGIYLMHGSFTLLIFADKIEIATSETVSHACETMIRAHEVCVTTLNTEYQVSCTL
jgi:xylanolytic transcriptional activator XlnR